MATHGQGPPARAVRYRQADRQCGKPLKCIPPRAGLSHLNQNITRYRKQATAMINTSTVRQYRIDHALM